MHVFHGYSSNYYLYLQDSTGRLKGAAFPRLRAHQRCEVARGQVLGGFGSVVVLLQLVLPEGCTVVMWKCLGGWRFMKVYMKILFGFLGYWNWLKLKLKVVDMSWYDHILIICCWVNYQRSQTWPEMPIVYLRQYVKQIYKIWIRRCLIFVGRIPHDMNRVWTLRHNFGTYSATVFGAVWWMSIAAWWRPRMLLAKSSVCLGIVAAWSKWLLVSQPTPLYGIPKSHKHESALPSKETTIFTHLFGVHLSQRTHASTPRSSDSRVPKTRLVIGEPSLEPSKKLRTSCVRASYSWQNMTKPPGDGKNHGAWGEEDGTRATRGRFCWKKKIVEFCLCLPGIAWVDYELLRGLLDQWPVTAIRPYGRALPEFACPLALGASLPPPPIPRLASAGSLRLAAANLEIRMKPKMEVVQWERLQMEVS